APPERPFARNQRESARMTLFELSLPRKILSPCSLNYLAPPPGWRLLFRLVRDAEGPARSEDFSAEPAAERARFAPPVPPAAGKTAADRPRPRRGQSAGRAKGYHQVSGRALAHRPNVRLLPGPLQDR